MEIEQTTQTRKRGRPFGTKRREAGYARTVHVPERVAVWLNDKVMKLGELVSDAPKWYDRMVEQTGELQIADAREKTLEDERASLRRTIAKLTEENAELMRFKARTVDKLKNKELNI